MDDEIALLEELAADEGPSSAEAAADLAARPELDPWFGAPLYQAFAWLSELRPAGWGPCPIPLGEILAFARAFPWALGGCAEGEFAWFIREMDRAWMACALTRQKSQA